MAKAERKKQMDVRRSREGYARTAHTMVQPVRGVESAYRKILFRNGDLIRLCLGSGGRCRRKGGMGGQDGLWAGSDAR